MLPTGTGSKTRMSNSLRCQVRTMRRAVPGTSGTPKRKSGLGPPESLIADRSTGLARVGTGWPNPLSVMRQRRANRYGCRAAWRGMPHPGCGRGSTRHPPLASCSGVPQGQAPDMSTPPRSTGLGVTGSAGAHKIHPWGSGGLEPYYWLVLQMSLVKRSLFRVLRITILSVMSR
jgi:hypothetical protein